jgi:putative spermidine/putrescine transport system permease protein
VSGAAPVRPPPPRRRRRVDWPKLALLCFVLLFLVFIVGPIAAVVAVSFSSSSFIIFPIPGLSWRWYWRILEYRPFIDSLILSIELALASAACGAVLGVPAALALARAGGGVAAATANFLLAPISVPAIVLGFALLYFLSALSFGITFAALLVTHTVVAIPYIVRTVLATYRALPAGLEEAAFILGATRWQTFRLLTLPLIRPGVFAGALFAILTSLDNLPLSYFFSSATTSTLPVVVLSYMESQFDPSIAAISTVQLALAVIALLVLDRVYGIERLTAT